MKLQAQGYQTPTHMLSEVYYDEIGRSTETILQNIITKNYSLCNILA